MSRIEELIREKCPDGVEYKQIMSIAQVSIGEFVHKSNQSNEAPYPVYNGGTSNTGFYEKYNRTENKIIISARGANAGFVNRVFTKYWSGNSCYTIDVKDSTVNWSYVYYYLKNNEQQLVGVQQNGGIPAISKKQVEELEIPVPPIEVQQEIVRVLDKFTELEAGLQDELEARKKQYEYYRDALLTFGEDAVEYKMGDVLTFLNGRAYKQEELLSEGKYPVLRVGNFYTNDSWYYSDLELESNKYCEKGDLLYSWAATLGPKIWDGDRCIYHYHIWKILFDENLIDKNYLFYYLQYDLSNIARSTTNSTMIHVSMGSMKERIISIPSMQEQKRIVEILNRFNELCNDVTKGLPAEVEVRKKQYEHYRDLLLSFERLGE